MKNEAPNPFPLLFSETQLGPTKLKNRIVSTGHHTYLADAFPNDELVAYHEERAKGGVGLIIVEVAGVHQTALFSPGFLMATTPDCIPGYRRIVEACHPHGTRVFAQLFHPGREVRQSRDGFQAVAYAPSSVPNERFHIMPRALSTLVISEIIQGYGKSAGYLKQAGVDGIEFVASHGYLPAQFLNPTTNQRTDAYGGSFEARIQFVREALTAIRETAGGLTIGMRISADEKEPNGLKQDTVVNICKHLNAEGLLDYVSVTAGSSSSCGGALHIVPPMAYHTGYTAPLGAAIKSAIDLPVILAGRINQPQDAEQVLIKNEADLCGMTRALICDPHLANKARVGKLDDIRACIACNQACIGRGQKNQGISCIQHPETGRETRFRQLEMSKSPKSVMVIGGGPAGMKAAAVAAERGHKVTLYEASAALGGQVKLARQLPGRDEFGGIVTNLEREMQLAGVDFRLSVCVDETILNTASPDAIVLATGARPYIPDIEGADEAHILSAWDVIEGANVGGSVVIADWKCDWIGLGIAEMLAAQGSRVRLCVNGEVPGETIQAWVRYTYLGRLFRLGVDIVTHVRLFGVDSNTAYFQNTLNEDAVILENVDTVVLALGNQSDTRLENILQARGCEVHIVGDCLTPRTAEEAVYEGLLVGRAI